MKKITTLLTVLLLTSIAVAENTNDQFTVHSDIAVTDSGWSTGTVTSDCSPDYDGWCDDRWILTLSVAKDVTIGVEDCCLEGDYYEVYIDDALQYTTPIPDDWGVSPGSPSELSSGSFTVSLLPGTYEIEVRDAAFQAHVGDESGMCPAGFTVWGELSDYTGEIQAPEFGSLAIALAILLTTPGIAYLMVRRRG